MKLFFVVTVFCSLFSCKYGHIDYSKYNDISINIFPVECHKQFPVSMRDQVKSTSTSITCKGFPQAGRFLCLEYSFQSKDSIESYLRKINITDDKLLLNNINYTIFHDIQYSFDGIVIYNDSIAIPYFTAFQFLEFKLQDELPKEYKTYVLGMKLGRFLPPDELIKDDFIPGKFNHGASWGVTVNESRLVVLSWVTMW